MDRNNIKSYSASKHNRTKKHKNKYSKFNGCNNNNRETISNRQDLVNTVDICDNEGAHLNDKYAKRKIENNLRKYDISSDSDADDSSSNQAIKEIREPKSKYVPVEVLSVREIQKQLNKLPVPKPQRNMLQNMNKDISVEDAAFWYDVLPNSTDAEQKSFATKKNKQKLESNFQEKCTIKNSDKNDKMVQNKSKQKNLNEQNQPKNRKNTVTIQNNTQPSKPQKEKEKTSILKTYVPNDANHEQKVLMQSNDTELSKPQREKKKMYVPNDANHEQKVLMQSNNDRERIVRNPATNVTLKQQDNQTTNCNIKETISVSVTDVLQNTNIQGKILNKNSLKFNIPDIKKIYSKQLDLMTNNNQDTKCFKQEGQSTVNENCNLKEKNVKVISDSSNVIQTDEMTPYYEISKVNTADITCHNCPTVKSMPYVSQLKKEATQDLEKWLDNILND